MRKINHHINILITILLLSFLSINVSLSAEESGPTNSQTFHISLGAGVAIKNNIRKDNNESNHGGDVIASPIPLLQISWGPVALGQKGLSLALFGDKEFSGYINIDRAGDNYYATGMSARYDSWFFGGGLRYQKFHFYISRDINGRSKGLKLGLNYMKTYRLSERSFAAATLGLECYNKNFAEYYYGVKTSEATAARFEYHPKAYCIPGVSLFPGYKVTEKFSLITGASLKIITKEVRHSPTTKGGWLEGALIFGGLWKF